MKEGLATNGIAAASEVVCMSANRTEESPLVPHTVLVSIGDSADFEFDGVALVNIDGSDEREVDGEPGVHVS